MLRFQVNTVGYAMLASLRHTRLNRRLQLQVISWRLEADYYYYYHYY